MKSNNIKNENNRENNRMNNIKMTGIIIGIMLIIFCVIFILGKTYDHSSKPSSIKKVEDQLNIAIVNEDQGVSKDYKIYRLGNQYVNQLKDTKNKKYKVVSRSIAEHGLKEHSYQLVVFIPESFSKQILEINNANPDQLPIQYKIEAKNKSEKEAAEKEANSLIKSLNQRLVDMYALGMMGSLYDAQKNVAGIYERQGKLATDYEKNLSQPIQTLQSGYPKFGEWAKNINKQNNSVKESMIKNGKDTVDATNQMIESATQPLLQQIEEKDNLYRQQVQDNDTKSKEQYDLMERMMSENSEELKSTLDELTADIKENQQLLEETIQQSSNEKDDMTNSDQFLETFSKYDQAYAEELTKLEKAFDKEKQDLQKELDTVKNKEETDENDHPQLTVEDYLRETDDTLYQKLQYYLSHADILNQQLALLPVMNPDELIGFSEEERQNIEQSIQVIKRNNQLLTEKGIQINNMPNDTTQKEWEQYLEATKQETDSENQEITQVVELTKLEGLDELKKSMSLEIALENSQYHLGDMNKLNSDAKFKVEKIDNQHYKITFETIPDSFKIPVVYSLKDAQDNSTLLTLSYHCPKIEEEIIVDGKVVKNDGKDSEDKGKDTAAINSNNSTSSSMPRSTSSSNHAQTDSSVSDGNKIEHASKLISIKVPVDYSKAKDSIETLVQSDSSLSLKRKNYVELYKQAAALSQERVKEAEEGIIESLLAIDLNNAEYLMVVATLSDSMNRYEDGIQSIKEKQASIKQLKEEYLSTLPKYNEETSQLLGNIEQVMNNLNDIQSKLNEASADSAQDGSNDNLSDSVADASKEVTNDYTTAFKELTESKEDTSSIADLAEANATEFEMISDELDNLGNDLTEVEKNGKAIDKNANQLQDNFKKELAKSGDFTKSFIQVLNAGYKDGVPNEQLMSFIANPLNSKGDISVKEKDKVYQTGLWVMLMIVLAVFIASVICKSKYELMEHYFSNYEGYVSHHLIKGGLLTILGIIFGYVLAKLSIAPLDIKQQYHIFWIMQMMIMMLILIYSSYILMNYLGVYGLGIQTALVMLFIFNIAKPLTITWLSRLNLYEHINNQFILMIGNNPKIFIHTVVMAIIMMVLGLMIVFVPNYKEIKKEPRN